MFEPDLKPNDVQHSYSAYFTLCVYWVMSHENLRESALLINCASLFFSLDLLPRSWLRGPKWHTAPHFIDELWPSSLTLCCYLTSHVGQHSYPQSAALEEMKKHGQSKWFTLGLTQHIDPSKLLLNASPEGHSVLYCTTISEATGLFAILSL